MGPVPGFASEAEKLVGVGAGPEHAGRGVTVPAPQRGAGVPQGQVVDANAGPGEDAPGNLSQCPLISVYL
jgi:hypothetical protein